MPVSRLCLLFLFSSLVIAGLTGRLAVSEDKPAANSQLSTHVLNTTSGKPAAGMTVLLQMQAREGWEELSRGETDGQGRIRDLSAPGKTLAAKTYRLVFETGAYFKSQGTKTFYPTVEVIFAIENADEHYPLRIFHISRQLNAKITFQSTPPFRLRESPMPSTGTQEHGNLPPTLADHRANEISARIEERHDKLKTCPTNGRGISFPPCLRLKMGGTNARDGSGNLWSSVDKGELNEEVSSHLWRS